MSTVKIRISSEGYGLQIPRTTVQVDGRFAYQSGNHPKVEAEHLQKLIELLDLDNTEVINMSLDE